MRVYNTGMNKTEMTQFQDTLEGLQEFILDMDADLEMAFDWVQDQSGVNPSATPSTWDAFIKAFEAAQ